jgi:hypothetical protein
MAVKRLYLLGVVDSPVSRGERALGDGSKRGSRFMRGMSKNFPSVLRGGITRRRWGIIHR